MAEGNIKWFNKEKGFGFITVGKGADIFVHVSTLQISGIDPEKVRGEDKSRPGERVSFDIKEERNRDGTMKQSAVNLKLLKN